MPKITSLDTKHAPEIMVGDLQSFAHICKHFRGCFILEGFRDCIYCQHKYCSDDCHDDFRLNFCKNCSHFETQGCCVHRPEGTNDHLTSLWWLVATAPFQLFCGFADLQWLISPLVPASGIWPEIWGAMRLRGMPIRPRPLTTDNCRKGKGTRTY